MLAPKVCSIAARARQGRCPSSHLKPNGKTLGPCKWRCSGFSLIKASGWRSVRRTALVRNAPAWWKVEHGGLIGQAKPAAFRNRSSSLQHWTPWRGLGAPGAALQPERAWCHRHAQESSSACIALESHSSRAPLSHRPACGLDLASARLVGSASMQPLWRLWGLEATGLQSHQHHLFRPCGSTEGCSPAAGALEASKLASTCHPMGITSLNLRQPTVRPYGRGPVRHSYSRIRALAGRDGRPAQVELQH